MSAFPRTCRDGLVIFGLATKALPDRCGVRRGPGLWRRFLSLLRAGEALPERWSDRSGRLWHRFLFSRRLHHFLRARQGTAFCLLGFLRHVQPPNGSKTPAPHTAVYLSVLSFSRSTMYGCTLYPKSGHLSVRVRCPLSDRSGHSSPRRLVTRQDKRRWNRPLPPEVAE